MTSTVVSWSSALNGLPAQKRMTLRDRVGSTTGCDVRAGQETGSLFVFDRRGRLEAFGKRR